MNYYLNKFNELFSDIDYLIVPSTLQFDDLVIISSDTNTYKRLRELIFFGEFNNRVMIEINSPQKSDVNVKCNIALNFENDFRISCNKIFVACNIKINWDIINAKK
jgi:hypothetical protein